MAQEICDTINKSALLHKRMMGKILDRFELTYAQYQVLKTIKKHQTLSAKEILVYLDTDKATLSGILGRLERNGLIKREKDPSDRRLMHISLTAASIALCDNVEVIENTCANDLTKGIKTREMKNFFNVFERIVENQHEKITTLIKETKTQEG